jgi:hypothetical protein
MHLRFCGFYLVSLPIGGLSYAHNILMHDPFSLVSSNSASYIDGIKLCL